MQDILHSTKNFSRRYITLKISLVNIAVGKILSRYTQM